VGLGATTGRDRAIAWRILLVALGAWSIVPPYLGPEVGLELDVSSSVEFVDHVVPGIVVVAAGGLALVLARRRAAESMLGLAATGACFLAGLWSTTSHVPLWLDAGESDTPWDSVLLHATSGPAIMALALWLLLRAPEEA
jgi:hypothetical protein